MSYIHICGMTEDHEKKVREGDNLHQAAGGREPAVTTENHGESEKLASNQQQGPLNPLVPDQTFQL